MIRSHGVGKSFMTIWKNTDFPMCGCNLSLCSENSPDRREEESRAGAHIVIIGDPDHPEVVWAGA